MSVKRKRLGREVPTIAADDAQINFDEPSVKRSRRRRREAQMMEQTELAVASTVNQPSLLQRLPNDMEEMIHQMLRPSDIGAMHRLNRTTRQNMNYKETVRSVCIDSAPTHLQLVQFPNVHMLSLRVDFQHETCDQLANTMQVLATTLSSQLTALELRLSRAERSKFAARTNAGKRAQEEDELREVLGKWLVRAHFPNLHTLIVQLDDEFASDPIAASYCYHELLVPLLDTRCCPAITALVLRGFQRPRRDAGWVGLRHALARVKILLTDRRVMLHDCVSSGITFDNLVFYVDEARMSRAPADERTDDDLDTFRNLRLFPKLRGLVIAGGDDITLHDIPHKGMEFLRCDNHMVEGWEALSEIHHAFPSLTYLDVASVDVESVREWGPAQFLTTTLPFKQLEHLLTDEFGEYMNEGAGMRRLPALSSFHARLSKRMVEIRSKKHEAHPEAFEVLRAKRQKEWLASRGLTLWEGACKQPLLVIADRSRRTAHEAQEAQERIEERGARDAQDEEDAYMMSLHPDTSQSTRQLVRNDLRRSQSNIYSDEPRQVSASTDEDSD
jgi:hypothetical protein